VVEAIGDDKVRGNHQSLSLPIGSPGKSGVGLVESCVIEAGVFSRDAALLCKTAVSPRSNFNANIHDENRTQGQENPLQTATVAPSF
jgi:hypothetical protein